MNQKNDPEAIELINDNECIEDKQMKEWHFPILMVVMILLFGFFTGIAVFFGLAALLLLIVCTTRAEHLRSTHKHVRVADAAYFPSSNRRLKISA